MSYNPKAPPEDAPGAPPPVSDDEQALTISFYHGCKMVSFDRPRLADLNRTSRRLLAIQGLRALICDLESKDRRGVEMVAEEVASYQRQINHFAQQMGVRR